MYLRLVYKKEEGMRFLGHLEMLRMMERAFRRSGLPLSYSQGFNPHPQFNFAAPLGVGVSSEYEIVDVRLEEAVDVNLYIEKLNEILPTGITVTKAKMVETKKKLMAIIAGAKYKIYYPENTDKKMLKDAFDAFLASSTHEIERQNKKKKWVKFDIRPHLHEVTYHEDGIEILVSQGSSGNLKPDVLLKELVGEAFFPVSVLKYIHRTGLFFTEQDKFKDLYNV